MADFFPDQYWSGAYFGQPYWAGDQQAGNITASLAGTSSLTGTLTGVKSADDRITGGGPEVRRKPRRWHVKVGKRLEYFDTAEAAYARFSSLYETEDDAPKTRKTQRRAAHTAPRVTVEAPSGPVEVTRAFISVARSLEWAPEPQRLDIAGIEAAMHARAAEQAARTAVALRLVEIEIEAGERARRAAQAEDDAAAILLLLT